MTLFVPGERRDFSKSFLEAMGYSALNFALLSWLIFLIHKKQLYESHEVWYFFLIFIIMFVAPVLWTFLLIRLRSWRRVAKYVVHPIQKPWDYVFGKGESHWIIVHLKDGRRIGGKYHDRKKSFVSSAPADEQIYLEEVWKLDSEGSFIKPVERSAGVIVLRDEILAVEFFKVSGGTRATSGGE